MSPNPCPALAVASKATFVGTCTINGSISESRVLSAARDLIRQCSDYLDWTVSVDESDLNMTLELEARQDCQCHSTASSSGHSSDSDSDKELKCARCDTQAKVLEHRKVALNRVLFSFVDTTYPNVITWILTSNLNAKSVAEEFERTTEVLVWECVDEKATVALYDAYRTIRTKKKLSKIEAIAKAKERAEEKSNHKAAAKDLPPNERLGFANNHLSANANIKSHCRQRHPALLLQPTKLNGPTKAQLKPVPVPTPPVQLYWPTYQVHSESEFDPNRFGRYFPAHLVGAPVHAARFAQPAARGPRNYVRSKSMDAVRVRAHKNANQAALPPNRALVVGRSDSLNSDASSLSGDNDSGLVNSSGLSVEPPKSALKKQSSGSTLSASPPRPELPAQYVNGKKCVKFSAFATIQVMDK